MRRRKVGIPVAISLFVVIFSLLGCEKSSLDQQMEELCKKDGGVKVYETVTLPPEMFDRWGDPFPGWRSRSQEDRLGLGYRYVVETTYLKKGDPLKGEGRLDRTVEKIIRMSDGKLLGESISYGRSGGDFLPFAHPTSKSCPVYKDDSEGLIKSVFVKGGDKNAND
ncbi:hypothetical protein [Geothermobacter hydrogeniphilus]|uniref:hypothetical protein n=1 Tax=Geothermobacter hydrogeniphilus TaxID=1969733 RepID=UPI0011AF5902|nr:hypothetical protein [Geothermobacter hydrogeniphilus]